MSKPRIKLTQDGLRNVVTGMGGRSQQSSHSRYQFDYSVQWPELEAAFQDNWIARQIVEVPVMDGLREWRYWNTKEGTEEIERAEHNMCVKSVLEECLINARLYGGAGIVIIMKNQDLSEPLDIESIKKGDLQRFEVISAANLTGTGVYDNNLLSENYMLPEMYQVKGTSALIHHSRIIRDFGEYLPKNLRANQRSGWGDSALRKCFEQLKGIDSSYKAVVEMMNRSNYDILKVQGLQQMLSTGNENGVMERMQLHGMSMSSFGFSFADKEGEEIERLSYQFGGISDTLSALNTFISGASDIPVTRLFGESAKGMSATGEGDMNNYYNMIAGKQESKYRRILTQIDEVVLRSELGSFPEDYSWDWNPLSQPSDQEVAQTNLAQSNADNIYLQSGIIKPHHILKRLQQEGTYAISDEEVDQAENESEDLGRIDELDLEPGYDEA